MMKLCVLFLASYFCYTAALPPCTCGRNVLPVCGSDGVTYSNECLLDCKKSQGNADLHVANKGSCIPPSAAEHNCVCHMDYRPVCGTDGQTYGNACALNCEKAKTPKLEKKSDGACPDNDQDETMSAPAVCKACTRDMKPVCGTDGVSYNNECLLNCAAADQNKEIKVSRKGRCDEGKVDTEFDEDQCECTRELIPVCGKNGVKYSNKCMMKCAGVEMAQQGDC